MYNVKTNVLNPKRSLIILDDTAKQNCFMGGEDISIYKGTLSTEGFTIARSGKLNSVKSLLGTYKQYLKETVEHSSTGTKADHKPLKLGTSTAGHYI